MNYIEIGTKAHKHASIAMLIGSTITFALMYSPQPLISLYSKQYNIPPETAGLSISLTTMSLAVSMFFVSIFTNALRRKSLMGISLMITSCLTILASFVPNFNLFLASRFFIGVSIACFPSTAMAYLNEEFSSKDIGRVMGYYISGTAVGGLTGRIIIGPLTDLMNWHMAFFVQGIVCLLGSLWFIKYLPESRNFTKMDISMEQWISAIKKTLFNGRLFSLYITGFLLLGSFVAILNYIGYPLTRPPYNLSQTLFGFLFFVNLFGVWSSILFGKLADRYTRKYVMALAIVIIIAGALLTLNVHLIVKIIGVAAVAFGFMAGHSVASSWVGLMASREHKGQAASFYLLFYYTGSSLVGWSGGKILSHYGWNTLVYFVCVLLFASILVSCYPWSLMSKKSLLSLEPVSEGHTSGFE